MDKHKSKTIPPSPPCLPSDAEEMRRRYEFIINTSRDFMTLINRSYVYEAANDAYCAAHDKTREEVIGKTLADLWGEKLFLGLIKGHLDRCFAGEEVNYQAFFAFPRLEHRYFDVTCSPYLDRDGLVSHVVVVSRDTTERKSAEEALRISYEELERKVDERSSELGAANEELQKEIAEHLRTEEMLKEKNSMLQTLINAIPDVVFFKDTEGRHLLGNKVMEEFMGLSQEEFVGESVADLSPPEVAEACRRSDAEALQAGGASRVEESYTDKNGAPRFLDVVKAPIYSAKGGLLGLVGVGRDITERKLMEVALRNSEEKFRTLYESSLDALFIIDMNGTFLDVNKTGYERLGYTKEEMLSMNISQLDPPEFASLLPQRMEHMQKEGKGVFESAHLRKDGAVMPVEINACVMRVQGRNVFFSIIRDITERKMAESQIQQALQEKETLLRELYHRTKNNMQVITSLLNLQAKEITDKKTLQILEDTKSRIRSMALVHEKLYKAKNLSHVSLRDYVQDLAQALMKSHNADKEQVTLCVDIEKISVSIDTITPLGLVINELMTNALKYAFPDNTKGAILIKALVHEDKSIELTFSDNGIGIPEHIDLTKSESLGLKIVRTLVVSQIKGKLEILAKNGTTVRIKFKDKDMLARI
jgi:PAS domain S-box-containing protein